MGENRDDLDSCELKMVMLDVTSRYGRPCNPAIATKYTLCPIDLIRNSPAAQEKQNQHWDFKCRRSHKLPATHKTPLVKCTNLLTKHFLKNPKPNNLPSSTALWVLALREETKPRKSHRKSERREGRDNLKLDSSTQQLLISSHVFHSLNMYLTELTMVLFICLVIFNLCCFTVTEKTRHYCQFKESLLTW